MSVKRLVGHAKSVNACDWSSFYKFVCSGGQDRAVILWNPFSQKPLASLVGHAAPITAVAVNDRENLLISISTDKCIKAACRMCVRDKMAFQVWDIRNHGCLQTFADKERYHPNNTVGAMLLDYDQQRLICGNKKIKAWALDTTRQSHHLFHEAPIVGLLFNSNFDEMISADSSGTLCIWNAETGELRCRFCQVHGEDTLTAIAFDNNARRLLTTTDNGKCHVLSLKVSGIFDSGSQMWNFSNGSCLKRFHVTSGMEICDVACLKLHGRTKIITAGWDKKLSLFEDNMVRKNIEPIAALSGHQADIISLAVADGLHLLASADFGGVILVWNSESWTLKKKLTPKTPLPISKIKFFSDSLKQLLVALSAHGMVRVWNVFEGCIACEISLSWTPTAMDISLNHIAVGTEQGCIQVILELSETHDGISITSKRTWKATNEEVVCLQWKEEAEKLVVATGDMKIAVWTSDGQSCGTFVQTSPERIAQPAYEMANQEASAISLNADSISLQTMPQEQIQSEVNLAESLSSSDTASDEDIPLSLWQQCWKRS